MRARGEDVPATRVLIADDERNIRRTLAVVLESLGCAVVEAGSATAPLETARRGPLGLAFVDLPPGAGGGGGPIPPPLPPRPGPQVVVVTPPPPSRPPLRPAPPRAPAHPP